MSFKGKKHTEESRKKIGRPGMKFALGTHHKKSEETKRRISEAKKGKKRPDLSLRNRQNPLKKEQNPNWKGGITSINEQVRKSKEYKLWRDAVFKRDAYRCVWCKLKCIIGVKIVLHADHIKPFCLYPELRFAIDNGRTLCKDCHYKTNTFGTKALKYKI